MPYTISHAALAVPLWRRSKHKLSLSALIIGSMIPDLASILRVAPSRTASHTLGGAFFYGFPLALGLLLVYHHVVKRPLLVLLPPAYSEPMATPDRRFSFRSPRQVMWIFISVAVGILGHLLWDELTHDGVLTRPFPAYVVTVPVLGTFIWYRLLQHVSTIAGLLLLAWWFARWLLDHPVRGAMRTPSAWRLAVIAAMILTALITGIAVGRAHLVGFHGTDRLHAFARWAAIGAMLGLAAAMVVYGVAVQLIGSRRILPARRRADRE